MNGGTGTVSIINPVTNTVANTMNVGSNPDQIEFTPSGNLAYVTNINSNTLSVIDPSFLFTVNATSASTGACKVAGTGIASGGSVNTLLANTFITCNGLTDGVLKYNLYKNGVSVANTVAGIVNYNALWDNQKDSYVWNTIGDGNYPATSISFSVNSIVYDLSVGTNAIAYETFPENEIVNINITKAASNAIIIFTENNINYNSVKQNVPATNQIFNVYYTIGLIASNNLAWTANANLIVNLSNGMTLNEGAINSIAQKIYWNYVPVVTANPYNIILGENETVSMNLQNPKWICAIRECNQHRHRDRDIHKHLLRFLGSTKYL